MAPDINVDTSDFERAKKLLKFGNVEYKIPEANQIADLNRSNWIVVPYEFTGGKYSLEVNPARMSYNSAVEKVGKELNLKFANTSKDSLRRKFIGNKSWFEFLKMNLALGVKTLNMNEFADFGRLLYQGMQGMQGKDVYDVSGRKIDEKTLRNYFEDIFKAKAPWRAENIDEDFKVTKDRLYANSNHRLENGILAPQSPRILDKNTLMKDKTPGISLESWLEAPTRQGFPSKKTESGNLYYWAPMKNNNSVARFYAYSVRAILDCVRYPSYRYSYLGVRAAKQRE